MSIIAGLNIDTLSFSDIRCMYRVGRAWSEGVRRNIKRGMKFYVKTRLGEIAEAEWEKAAKAMIKRSNEEALFQQLKEHYSDLPFGESHVLECHVSRIFDNELWVGFVPFNRKYRPDVLSRTVLVKVKCECCDDPGLITEANFDYYRSQNKCFCPVCGRFSKMEVVSMQKINSFTILEITLRGFKCFKDETSFNLGDMTYVKGANGFGKSSIADAISFAFAGSSFFGEKGLDKLINSEAGEMQVSIRLVDENGELHTLTRTRKKDTTTIVFDAYNLRQSDMNEVFGERDLFLSIFNPLYFIETLGADGKEMLERMLPFVSPETVIAALSEPLRSEMKGETMLSPETFIKNTREEIRELETKLVYLQGQSDLHENERKQTKALKENALEELEGVDILIETLESERDANRLTSEEDERLIELYRRRDELVADDDTATENNQLKSDIKATEIELAKLTVSVYQPALTTQIAEKDAELKLLYSDYDQISDLISKIKPGFKCPSCFHEITEDNLSVTKGSIKKRLNECVESGRKVKNELTLIKNQEANGQQAFDKRIASETALLEERLKCLQKNYQDKEANRIIAENERDDEIDRISDEIQSMEDKKVYGNLSNSQIQELNALYDKKSELAVQLDMYTGILEKQGFKDQIADTEKEIKRLKVRVSNAIIYIGTKNELLFKRLNLNRVKFSLNEIIKTTGEIKDTFKFTYDGREYRRLSLSEKIRAGLEIAELIKKLSGRDYPTFIDNGESICAIDNVRPTSQLIFALVERGRPLTVEKKETALRKAG